MQSTSALQVGSAAHACCAAQQFSSSHASQEVCHSLPMNALPHPGLVASLSLGCAESDAPPASFETFASFDTSAASFERPASIPVAPASPASVVEEQPVTRSARASAVKKV